MNYHDDDTSDIDNGYGMAWRGWRGDRHSLRTIEMAIKENRGQGDVRGIVNKPAVGK